MTERQKVCVQQAARALEASGDPPDDIYATDWLRRCIDEAAEYLKEITDEMD